MRRVTSARASRQLPDELTAARMVGWQAGCCGAPQRPITKTNRKLADELAKDPRNLGAEEAAIRAELAQLDKHQSEVDLALSLSLDEMAGAARDAAPRGDAQAER